MSLRRQHQSSSPAADRRKLAPSSAIVFEIETGTRPSRLIIGCNGCFPLGGELAGPVKGWPRRRARKDGAPLEVPARVGLLRCWQPVAVEAPPAAPERAPRARPLWRSSLKAVGSAVARVASICEPVCSGVVHADAMVPWRRRKRDIHSRTSSPRVAAPPVSMPAGEWDNWRCAIRGTSRNDDVLMRRFVLEEDATRRRMELQLVANRYGRCWTPPGPSRLSLMSRAGDDDDDNEAAGENSSTSARCSSEAQSI